MTGRFAKTLAATAALALAGNAAAQRMSADNPTCPEALNWADNRPMRLTPVERDGRTVLLAEGGVDADLPVRLQEALDADPNISEIWLRSPGGSAVAGNEAGTLLRSNYPGIVTRVPAGWACFSACNFVFMGGTLRYVEPGGQFIVHMFALNGDVSVDQATQTSALMATEDNDFLIRMGVSRLLLSEVMYTTRARGRGETMRCLTDEEAFRYNVDNTPDQ